MPYIHVSASDILDDLDDDELIEELESRGHKVLVDANFDSQTLIRTIYEKRRLGKDYQAELEQLIFVEIGRVI